MSRLSNYQKRFRSNQLTICSDLILGINASLGGDFAYLFKSKEIDSFLVSLLGFKKFSSIFD